MKLLMFSLTLMGNVGPPTIDVKVTPGEPRKAGVDGEAPGRVGVASLHAGAVEHALDTDAPAPGLIIAPDLPAADESAGGVRAEVRADHASDGAGNVV